MATASYTLAPGYVLTGTTYGDQSAPINYSINGIRIGSSISPSLGGGFAYSLVDNYLSEPPTYSLKVNNTTIEASIPKGVGKTIVASLGPGTASIEQAINKQVQVAAPAPAPAPTKVTSTSTSTQVTSTSNSTATTKTTVTKVSSPPATTDPSKLATATVLTKADLIQPQIVTDLKPTSIPEIDQPDNAPSSSGAAKGLTGAKQAAIDTATNQSQANFQAAPDWRVRLVLAPDSNYFYNAQNPKILAPLAKAKGVIFPYTPSITVSYSANYEGTSLTHTNYKIYQYQNSSVDSITISCDFTAQDTAEANYLLAVIHFFRSMTKMFYGQDNDPKNGTPPPLCYIQGMGGYQFNNLPLAINTFNYNLPNDVDYIPTTGHIFAGTTQPTKPNPATSVSLNSTLARLGSSLSPGGLAPPPSFGTNTVADQSATWVPTKIQLSINCLPIMSRNQVSNIFSLEKYASGDLLQGSNNVGGGFW